MTRKSEHRKAKPHGGKSSLLREFYAFVSNLPPEHRAAAADLLERAKAYDAHIEYGEDCVGFSSRREATLAKVAEIDEELGLYDALDEDDNLLDENLAEQTRPEGNVKSSIARAHP